jgi:hypothetical protein
MGLSMLSLAIGNSKSVQTPTVNSFGKFCVHLTNVFWRSSTSPITCQVLNCRVFSCVQVFACYISFASKTCKICQKYTQIGHAWTLMNASRMRSPTHRLVRGVGCAHLSQYTISETLLRTLACKSGVSNKPLYCREAKQNYIISINHLGPSYRRHIFIFNISSRNEVHVKEFLWDYDDSFSSHSKQSTLIWHEPWCVQLFLKKLIGIFLPQGWWTFQAMFRIILHVFDEG